MKTGWLIALGLGIAFIGQFIALGLGGAGHGWVTPFWASILLWPAYPVILVRTRKISLAGFGSLKIEIPILLLAAIADVGLVHMTKNEGVEYFWKVVRFEGWTIVCVWISIWLGWQGIAVANLMRIRRD